MGEPGSPSPPLLSLTVSPHPAIAVWTQAFSTHASLVHGSPSSQSTGLAQHSLIGVPAHIPSEHASSRVHGSPSSHGPALFAF
jgi:hypothetical protein